VSAPLISVTALDKTYVTRGRALVPALSGISLDIHAGEFVTIVGQSGCGKTTLLKILAGLVPQSAGVVTLRGQRMNGPSRDIGIVFQDPVLLPWRTVFRNVLLPAEVLGLGDHRDAGRVLPPSSST
jgi:NitT/TauT family transport system ATP-binding protein